MSDSRTVRIFLSSTFLDFAEERDLLVRKVFPELRRKCWERQVELVDVDLRWGITEKEAQQGRMLPICLAEIDRARPYFMAFLSERYGWVPKPEEYDRSLTLEQPWLDDHRGARVSRNWRSYTVCSTTRRWPAGTSSTSGTRSGLGRKGEPIGARAWSVR
jgi:Domain of unknown function (DUF4062)